jgi:hypothetical protein
MMRKIAFVLASLALVAAQEEDVDRKMPKPMLKVRVPCHVLGRWEGGGGGGGEKGGEVFGLPN